MLRMRRKIAREVGKFSQGTAVTAVMVVRRITNENPGN
jgi:hypothetical protein